MDWLMTQRLVSLELDNFRSFLGKHQVPLDANVVLLYGPNGSGKSNILHALELAITARSRTFNRLKMITLDAFGIFGPSPPQRSQSISPTRFLRKSGSTVRSITTRLHGSPLKTGYSLGNEPTCPS